MTAVAERYARAIGSSHLELKVEPGDLDTLIAAGMVTEGLGTGLMRLRFEYDAISRLPGARSMMPRLKSAGEVRGRLLAMAVTESARRSAGLSDDQLINIVARLLDQWLDPNCPNCDGRGSTGGYGVPMVLCVACSGSKRRALLWAQDTERLADWLGALMEAKVDAAMRRIQRLLRQN